MKRLDLHIVTDWNKLSGKQLMFLCRIFLAGLEHEAFRLRVFLKFTGVNALNNNLVNKETGEPYWLFKKKKVKFRLSNQELESFLKSVDYLAGDSRLTKNNFPSVRIPFRRYFGPSDKCYTLTYSEFIHAEKCLYAYQKTNRVKYMNELCAVLYRPEKENYNPKDPEYDGDRRQSFNDFIYPKRAWRFHLLGRRKRFAIYLFYTGCRNVLIDSFPSLFNSGVVSSEPVNPVKSLRKIIHDLNMGDITRNDQIYKKQVWEAFEHLNHIIENMPKQKKK